MSFFDQPYYAWTKANMSRIGMWPEQPKYTRIIRRLTALFLALTFVVPRLIRLNDIRENTDSLIHDMPFVLTGAGNTAIILRTIQNFDKITLSLENIERHWEMFKNTSAVIVLDKYAERGRYIVVRYTLFMSIAVLLYWSLCLSPMILDVVNPLNETRLKIFIFHTQYGVDADKYYWFIIAHEYIVTMTAVAIAVAMQTVFFTWAVHACALFEVVRYTDDKINDITRCNDWNYNKLCDCITAHEMAISFAELIESICSGPFAATLGCLSIMIVFTGIQALLYAKHRDVLMQSAIYIIAQVLSLYIISVPGQELMDHSKKIHTDAYDVEWSDMPVKAQKLLIPIMIRSNKPCCLTARKVYIFSVENFGLTIRTVISYFTIFAQMI